MGDTRSVATSGRYVITEKGRYDLICAPTCRCTPKLAGLLFECPECGTVFGHMRDLNLDRRPFNDKR